MLHQQHRQRRRNQRAAAETHDGHARRHARAVGKPFDQGRYRRDVADAEAAASQHAVAQVEQPELMKVNADGGHDEPAAEAQRGDEHGLARTHSLDPASKQRGRQAENGDRDGKHPAHLGQFPIAGRGMGEADEFGQRQIEGRECIRLTDRQMHRQGRPAEPRNGRNPAGATVLSRSRNDAGIGGPRIRRCS